MKTSQVGLDLIRSFEGLHLDAYLCPAQVWTIGIGHTGSVDGVPIKKGMRITEKKAFDLLHYTLASRYEPAVNKLGTMNQNQYDALVSFCYNLGPYIFTGSLLTAIKNKQWSNVASQMLAYNKARVNGVLTELPGLTRRRQAETKLLLTPIKEDTYVIKKTKIKINGVTKQVDAIDVNGNNYVKLQDIKDQYINVLYDSVNKLPTIETRR